MSRSDNQDPFLSHTHFVTGEIPSSLCKLAKLEKLYLYCNALSGKTNVFGTPPVMSHLTALSVSGEIPWEMLRTLVQEHSLRTLYLGSNEFTVDTIPEIVGTMTKLEHLDLMKLGYTGKSGTLKSGTLPVTSRVRCV